MSRATTRRKDIIAAVIIVGAAVVYWVAPGGPDFAPIESPGGANAEGEPVRPVTRTPLPGLGVEPSEESR